MRIHQLEVTAFGPFSGSESVDFDDLTSAGLFLLCGPTGAGKTSILDAICFGLYGEVPGDRNGAKRLRSDHAAPGVRPEVVLTMSISGRRLRIRRSPAWRRPKRRGTGTTLEPAGVVLEEHAQGGWVHLSSRLDETGHVVTELLGMNVTQFTQVAMLPQGRFQTFLRAKSEERHKVLQQLFRTSRFESIEKWLVSHRQSLRTANTAHQDAVASVLSRLSEAAQVDLPGDWDIRELAITAEDGRVADWASELLVSALAASDRTSRELQRATEGVETTRLGLQRALSDLGLRAKHREALKIEAALAAATPPCDVAKARLDAARRAAPVAPLMHVADVAERAADVARKNLTAVLADAARLLGAESPALTLHDLALAERGAHEAASIAKALLPREAELKEAQQRVERATSAMTDLIGKSAEVDLRCEEIPAELAELRTQLYSQATLAATLDAVVNVEKRLVDQLGAARSASTLRSEVGAARAQLHARINRAQSLRGNMYDIREARINGMAAELAAVLAVGGSCPVCGSADHPAVARSVVGSPSQTDEEQARADFEDADFSRQAQAEAVATLEHNLALAEQTTEGKGVADLERDIGHAREELDACRAAGAAQECLASAVASLEGELMRLRQLGTGIRADIARLGQQRDHAAATMEKVTAELSALFDEDEIADSVERLIAARTAAGAAFGRAREALAARDAAVTHAAQAHRHAVECAHEHGFDTVATTVAATLTRDEVGELEDLLRARAERRTLADTLFAEPGMRGALAASPPDLPAVEEAARDAASVLAGCGAGAQVTRARAARLARLQVELSTELDAWTPTRAAYSVSQVVSTLAEGKGADNRLQIRLSAYVLSAMLKQVVAAANERLHTMSDERYTLEQSAARGVGELRGGLSLMVRDEWTGESRDPATLSGGETFVASLALALGLADVVTQEAGGSNIDTLFIDEGFGSLDQETLDDVMTTLDSLRDGGRVVGIVSHVPELRTRVTAQLQIRKGRSGSHIVAARELV